MDSHLKAATILAHALDNQFNFFGRKFGLNGVIGLIPVVGDGLAAFLSFYLVWVGLQMNLPGLKITEMVANILINFLVGLIPILGDAVYFLRKPNLKNLKILKEYAKKRSQEGEVIQPIHFARLH